MHLFGVIRRATGPFGLMLLPLVSRTSVASGQERVRLSDPATCRCRIELTPIATLRPPPSQKAFVMPSAITRDSRGLLYVADEWGSPNVFVYDATGRPIRVIDRSAETSLGFGLVRSLAVGVGDTLHVFSYAESVYGPDGVFVRRTPVFAPRARVNGAVLYEDGTKLLQAHAATVNAFGLPYHFISSSGEDVAAFGAPINERNVGGAFVQMRTLTRSKNDRFWGSHVNRYELELWTRRGRHLRTLVRQVGWFHQWDDWDSRYDENPPPPRLQSLWEDQTGRVWTLTSVASPAWRPAPSPQVKGERAMGTIGTLFTRSTDSMLEIIDPRTESVFASQRIPYSLTTFLGDSVVAGVAAGAADTVSVTVWKVRVILGRGGVP